MKLSRGPFLVLKPLNFIFGVPKCKPRKMFYYAGKKEKKMGKVTLPPPISKYSCEVPPCTYFIPPGIQIKMRKFVGMYTQYTTT